MPVDLLHENWSVQGFVRRIARLEAERDELAARVRQLSAQVEVDRQAVESMTRRIGEMRIRISHLPPAFQCGIYAAPCVSPTKCFDARACCAGDVVGAG